MNQIWFEIYSFYKLCVNIMHSLLEVTFVFGLDAPNLLHNISY
jgi:hypothetical protein